METRIDPPHPLRTDAGRAALAEQVLPTERPVDSPVEAPDVLPEVSPQSDAPAQHVTEWQDAAAELQRQSLELKRHLAERLTDLDRREALVNAQTAELENQARAGRLWLREQHAVLDKREAGLTQRERALAEQASQISAAEAYHDLAREATEQEESEASAALARREAQLEALRSRLAAERQALDEAERRLRVDRQQIETKRLWASQQAEHQRALTAETARQLMQAVERRRLAVERQAERAVDAQRAWDEVRASRRALVQREQVLTTRERRFLKRVRAVRNRILERARRWSAQLRHKQEQLRHEHEELLARRVELEELRSEVLLRRRELLELRATTEHLLAELHPRGERRELVESLSTTRTAIAGQYQQSREELSQQKRALEELRSEVAARYSQLLRHRDEIINLARRRRLMDTQQQARQAEPPAA